MDEALCARYRRLTLAVSGGKDSCAMLDWFAERKERFERLEVLHVNHELRSEESDEDQRFVQRLCERYGLECRCHAVDVSSLAAERGFTVEQAGREARRKLFEQTVADGESERVVTAHHKDDLCESVLMHVLRGSGMGGLRGILPDDGKIIRPMLAVSREQIAAYCAERNLQWREDSSNRDDSFTRNRLRNRIVPLLEETYRGMSDNVARLSAHMRGLYPFLVEALPHAARNEWGESVFALELFERYDPAVMGAAILEETKKQGVREDVTSVHISAVSALAHARTGAQTTLPHGLSAHKDRDAVVLSRLPGASIEERKFALGQYDLGSYVLRIGKKQEEADDLRCDLRTLQKCVIRQRRQGDRIVKFGGGESSLGDYMTEKRIPARYRDRLAVIADGSRILAIPPYAIARGAAITTQTDEICWIGVKFKGQPKQE